MSGSALGSSFRRTRSTAGSPIRRSILSPMTKRRQRGNGDGTVYETSRPRKPWAAVLVVGWSLEGRPVRRARFASSEKEAKELLRRMREAVAGGDPVADEQLTVGSFLRSWHAAQRAHVRAGTWEDYAQHIRRILPHLGATKLRALRASHVNAMLEAYPDLSPYTIAGTRNLLSRALRDAEADRLVAHNPARLSRSPKLPSDGPKAPSRDAVRAILTALEQHRLSALYVLAAHTGLRLGEVTGLRWVDLEGETLTVRHALALTHDAAGVREYVLTEPKTERSKRSLILPPAALEALRSHRIRQGEERLAAGRHWRDGTGLMFMTAAGDPLHPNTVRTVIQDAAKRAGVARINPHDLRRFAATEVAATGDLKAAQGLLGHRSANLTADVYAATTDTGRRRAAAAMEEALGG